MAGSIDVLQGTLDMLVLKAVSFAPMHGYNILAWLRHRTDGELLLEDAALYPALHRLEARGLIDAEWGVSESNRRARYYRLTPAGRRSLRAERESWSRYVAVVAKIMDAPAVA
ncbi:MAG TPA: PadR family transcriptional regulator [Gemmatimonadaceae bacterium]|nr:PadR family transcriptional regulator [Gemmatimonadaceae bacterium]